MITITEKPRLDPQSHRTDSPSQSDALCLYQLSQIPIYKNRWFIAELSAQSFRKTHARESTKDVNMDIPTPKVEKRKASNKLGESIAFGSGPEFSMGPFTAMSFYKFFFVPRLVHANSSLFHASPTPISFTNNSALKHLRVLLVVTFLSDFPTWSLSEINCKPSLHLVQAHQNRT